MKTRKEQNDLGFLYDVSYRNGRRIKTLRHKSCPKWLEIIYSVIFILTIILLIYVAMEKYR